MAQIASKIAEIKFYNQNNTCAIFKSNKYVASHEIRAINTQLIFPGQLILGITE